MLEDFFSMFAAINETCISGARRFKTLGLHPQEFTWNLLDHSGDGGGGVCGGAVVRSIIG